MLVLHTQYITLKKFDVNITKSEKLLTYNNDVVKQRKIENQVFLELCLLVIGYYSSLSKLIFYVFFSECSLFVLETK